MRDHSELPLGLYVFVSDYNGMAHRATVLCRAEYSIWVLIVETRPTHMFSHPPLSDNAEYEGKYP
jgi:hypothetical protein